jgi:hypothetical protein
MQQDTSPVSKGFVLNSKASHPAGIKYKVLYIAFAAERKKS